MAMQAAEGAPSKASHSCSSEAEASLSFFLIFTILWTSSAGCARRFLAPHAKQASVSLSSLPDIHKSCTSEDCGRGADMATEGQGWNKHFEHEEAHLPASPMCRVVTAARER